MQSLKPSISPCILRVASSRGERSCIDCCTSRRPGLVPRLTVPAMPPTGVRVQQQRQLRSRVIPACGSSVRGTPPCFRHPLLLNATAGSENTSGLWWHGIRGQKRAIFSHNHEMREAHRTQGQFPRSPTFAHSQSSSTKVRHLHIVQPGAEALSCHICAIIGCWSLRRLSQRAPKERPTFSDV